MLPSTRHFGKQRIMLYLISSQQQLYEIDIITPTYLRRNLIAERFFNSCWVFELGLRLELIDSKGHAPKHSLQESLALVGHGPQLSSPHLRMSLKFLFSSS